MQQHCPLTSANCHDTVPFTSGCGVLNTVPFNCKQYLLSGAFLNIGCYITYLDLRYCSKLPTISLIPKPIRIPRFRTLLLRFMIHNSSVPSHTSHNSCQLEYLTITFTWLRKLTAPLGHRPIPFYKNVLCSLYYDFKDTACVINFRDIQQQLSAYKSIRAIKEDMSRVEI